MTKNMNWICPMTAILNFVICGKTVPLTAWHTTEMDSAQNFHTETINEVLFLKNAYRSLSRAIFQFFALTKMTTNLKIRHNSLSSVMQLLNPLYLLKQTVLFKMYVFITSKHVDSDNLCIYGFLVAIFKMLAKENDKKPKFGFSIIQLLFATNLQFLHLNVYLFTSKCILLRVINLI